MDWRSRIFKKITWTSPNLGGGVDRCHVVYINLRISVDESKALGMKKQFYLSLQPFYLIECIDVIDR